MDELSLLMAVLLLGNLLVGLRRVMRGPTAADRMLTALLFGTTGVAVLLLLADARSTPGLVDVALVFALLAAVSGAAFSQRAWREDLRRDNDREAADDTRGVP